jgi:predicted RNase H-like HicB family nuclease
MAVADPIETERDTLTIVYEDAGDGWVSAQIAEVPAAISQGRTRAEARANVISALHDLTHEPTLPERLLYRMRSLFSGR